MPTMAIGGTMIQLRASGALLLCLSLWLASCGDEEEAFVDADDRADVDRDGMPDRMSMPDSDAMSSRDVDAMGDGDATVTDDADADGGELVDAAMSCPSSETACGLECVDTSLSASHCGECFRECGVNQTCESGECVDLPCPSGQALCGSECADLSIDPAHCGRCDVACAVGQLCASSECACPDGQRACGGACTDVTSDPIHCGACDAPCTAGQLCSGGRCVDDCASGSMPCGGACVDTGSDPRNCGGCGAPCGADQICAGGTCRCSAGLTACGASCVDLDYDPLHCGACGVPCASGQVCVRGACETGCSTFEHLVTCGGICRRERSDEACNGCASCGSGFRCQGGGAFPTCACLAGRDLVCGGGCVDSASDPSHCGACDAPCAAGEVCDVGGCTTACTGARIDCGGACVDTTSDRYNCGTCGRVCRDDQYCRSGTCGCVSGTIECDGACIDPNYARHHCGMCGNACDRLEECRMGSCVCGSLLSDCSGECRDLGTDRDCGSCGNACTGRAHCSGGVCSTRTATAMDVGYFAACAIAGGTVYCWGGEPVVPTSVTPVAISGASPSSISVGYRHACGLVRGDVYCFGRNDRGQLNNAGAGTTSPVFVSASVSGVEVEVGAFTCVRDRTGNVDCWGPYIRSMGIYPAALHRISGITTAVDIAVGSDIGCAVLADGHVTCWTVNTAMPTSPIVTTVGGIADAVEVDITHLRVCIRRSSGEISCFGSTEKPTVILATMVEFPPVDYLMASSLTSLRTGNDHACSIDTMGIARCWGEGRQGQLGNGLFDGSTTPVRVYGLTNVARISTGVQRTCALLADGTIECWGAWTTTGAIARPRRFF